MVVAHRLILGRTLAMGFKPFIFKKDVVELTETSLEDRLSLLASFAFFDSLESF